MKKHILTLVILLITVFGIHAQQRPANRPKPAIILDGKLLSSGFDSLKVEPSSVENVVVLKERDKTELFGINDDNGLLIIITKEKKDSPENAEINKKLAKLNIPTKPRYSIDPNRSKPSRDSIPNGTFDFVSIEKQPEYPGGLAAFYRYLSSSIRFPKEDQKNRTYGKVFISFVVEKDGQLTNLKIMRGLSPTIDAEALRVIAASKKWNPGIQFGVPVRVKYNINVNFEPN